MLRSAFFLNLCSVEGVMSIQMNAEKESTKCETSWSTQWTRMFSSVNMSDVCPGLKAPCSMRCTYLSWYHTSFNKSLLGIQKPLMFWQLTQMIQRHLMPMINSDMQQRIADGKGSRHWNNHCCERARKGRLLSKQIRECECFFTEIFVDCDTTRHILYQSDKSFVPIHKKKRTQQTRQKLANSPSTSGICHFEYDTYFYGRTTSTARCQLLIAREYAWKICHWNFKTIF